MAKDTMVDDGAAIDRLYDGLATGNLAAAQACLTPDARLWHCFDRIAHDPDSIIKDWQALITHFPERYVEDVRRQATADGFVQQHLFVVKRADGQRMAWPVCVVVKTQGGKISRLDEYIDRAGSFTPPGP